MQKKNNIKKIGLMLVFLFSFVFQTAYSLSFKVAVSDNSDLLHKHINKQSAKEEKAEGNFVEEKTEKDSEIKYEFLSFIIPHLVFHLEHSSSEACVEKDKNSVSSRGHDIFIAIHNLRI